MIIKFQRNESSWAPPTFCLTGWHLWPSGCVCISIHVHPKCFKAKQCLWTRWTDFSRIILHVTDKLPTQRRFLTELHFSIFKPNLSHFDLSSSELQQHCLPLKAYFSTPHSSAHSCAKQRKVTHSFYIKPWMKLSLWGNYFGEKLQWERHWFCQQQLPPPAATQLGGRPFCSSVIAVLHCIEKKGL